MRPRLVDPREDTFTDGGDASMPDSPDIDPFGDPVPLEPVLE